MHEREPRLVADGVVAPDLGNVDRVLRRKAAGHVHAPGRNIQVERRAGPTQVRPLRHGLEMVDGFGRLDLDRAHQLAAAVCRGQHEVREDLHLTDADRNRLILPDIRDDVMPAFELDLQEPDDSIMLELLPDRPHQNRAHLTSARRQ